ncbi:MAG TPA: hypothetical protein VI542_19560 [Candidatus Tectomicrobia bacterium]
MMQAILPEFVEYPQHLHALDYFQPQIITPPLPTVKAVRYHKQTPR